jgi:16S rRNA (cytosine1402-N4)-methyltransferase
MQLDSAKSGYYLYFKHRFSFRRELKGPLDMRFNKKGTSAEDVVNSINETELSKIIFEVSLPFNNKI